MPPFMQILETRARVSYDGAEYLRTSRPTLSGMRVVWMEMSSEGWVKSRRAEDLERIFDKKAGAYWETRPGSQP